MEFLRGVQGIGYLCNGKTRIVEIVDDDGFGVLHDEVHHGVACLSLYGFGQVFHRYAQLIGIVTDLAVCLGRTGGEQEHEATDDVGIAVGVLIAGV